MRINAILDTTRKDQSIPPDLELSRLLVTLTKYMREAGVPIPPGHQVVKYPKYIF